MAMIACKSKSNYTIKQGKIRHKHDFLHPRSWIEVLKHYVLRRFSSLKKFRAFLPESVFGHFRSYALKTGKIRDFGHRWKTRVAGTFWFSEALGSAEPEAFLKRPDFLSPKKSDKKSQEIWENVVRNAKNRPWNATRQLFSGFFQTPPLCLHPLPSSEKIPLGGLQDCSVPGSC